MEAQDCINKIVDHLLGEDWYIVDPVGNEQANEIILEEIQKNYKKITMTPVEKYRARHPNCNWCTHCTYHSIHVPCCDGFDTCDLNNKMIKFYHKALFCKYYNVARE